MKHKNEDLKNDNARATRLRFMKKLCSAANLMEAHILLDLLAHANIEARLFNEHAQGGVGDIPFMHAYPEIWITRENDLARAQAVVRTYEKAPVETGVVFCRTCAEENPGNFQLCWRCGSGLDSAFR